MSPTGDTLNERQATVRQCVIFADERTLAPPNHAPYYLGAHQTTLSQRPLVAWLMREVARFGVQDFIIFADLSVHRISDLSEKLREHAPERATLRFVASRGVLQREQVVRANRELLEDRFLLFGGDTIFTGNLACLLKDAADDPEHIMARVLIETEVADEPGSSVRARRADIIAGNIKQQPIDLFNGVTLMKEELLDTFLRAPLLEQHLFPRAAESDQLRASYVRGRPITLDNFVGGQLSEPLFHRPALLLDRDGVINLDAGWVGSRDRFTWTPGAMDAVRLANDLGWHVFVVTNQSGVARGLYSEDDVHALHAWMINKLHHFGATIDDIRYCPYHPQAVVEKYRALSDWRKPGAGMIRDLIRTWDLDPQRCALIGDQATDLLAAKAGGVDAYLFPGGNLADFVSIILKNGKYA